MTIDPADLFLVNRANSTSTVIAKDLMAKILDDDLMVVNRGDQTYSVTGAEVKDSLGSKPIFPEPDDVTSNPAFIGGTGNSGDPFLLKTIGVRPGGATGVTEETITIAVAGATKDDLVVFTDNSAGAGTRFTQPSGVVGADGSWTGTLVYSDTPATTADTDYTGDIQIGDVHFRWTVEQGIDAIRPIAPTPSEITATPPFASGTGTAGDPYVCSASVAVPAGATIFSTQEILIIEVGGAPGELVRWTNNSDPSTGARFDQPESLTDGNAQWKGRIIYNDVPDTAVDQTYAGMLQIGTTYFRWEVAQQVVAAEIIEPTVIAPPDGAGIGGDVTYTPKTSAITAVSSRSYSTTYDIKTSGAGGTGIPWLDFPTKTYNSSTQQATDRTVGISPNTSAGAVDYIYYDFKEISAVQIERPTGAQDTTYNQHLWGTNDPDGSWTLVNVMTNDFRKVTGSGYRYYCTASQLADDVTTLQVINPDAIFPVTPTSETETKTLTFADANTYNADTDADMNQPISETFTAGQTVTGVLAGNDNANGVLVTDASGNTMDVVPSLGPNFSPVLVEANNWTSVTYGDGKFVAVSINGTNRAMYSTDGINWLPALGTVNNAWQSVTYGVLPDGTKRFVAVSSNGNFRVMYSDDGINWTGAPAVTKVSWQSVTYGAARANDKLLFVAVASSGTQSTMYSEDGITWEMGQSGYDNSWQASAYGDGIFVAVANDAQNRVIFSNNGTSWVKNEVNVPPNGVYLDVTYGVPPNGIGKFVAVANKYVLYSDNGTVWTRVTVANEQWSAVTYGGGKFVALAFGTGNVMYSDDGISWTVVNAATEANAWNSVTYGGGKFVAVSSSGDNRVAWSLAFGGTFVDGMEVVNSTTVTSTGPSAELLEFVGSTPVSVPSDGVNTWGDATWEVSTDSVFTAPMVGTKIITPSIKQTLLPADRGAIVLEEDTTYWARVSYNSIDPQLSNKTSDSVNFKTLKTEPEYVVGNFADYVYKNVDPDVGNADGAKFSLEKSLKLFDGNTTNFSTGSANVHIVWKASEGNFAPELLTGEFKSYSIISNANNKITTVVDANGTWASPPAYKVDDGSEYDGYYVGALPGTMVDIQNVAHNTYNIRGYTLNGDWLFDPRNPDPTRVAAFPEIYYDTKSDRSINGGLISSRFGINPNTANIAQLGIAKLTEQPDYPVAGYQAVGDKYQPIQDLSGDLELSEKKLELVKERNQQLRHYMAKDMIADAQALIEQWAAEDAEAGVDTQEVDLEGDKPPAPKKRGRKKS